MKKKPRFEVADDLELDLVDLHLLPDPEALKPPAHDLAGDRLVEAGQPEQQPPAFSGLPWASQ